MKRSHVIALAGISGALAYVSILLSFYVDIMSLSFGALAGICIMLPLTVGSITGAVFAYVSSGILAGLTIGFGAMTYIIFFGPFTILCCIIDFRLYDKMRLPKWGKILVGYIIKGIFYSAMVTGLYYLMSAFGNVGVIVESNLIWAFVLLLILAFFLFDILLHLVFVNLRYIINNRILKNNGNAKPKPRDKEADKPQDIDVFGIDESGETKDDNKEDKPPIGVPDDSTSRFEHFLSTEENDKKGDDESKKD